MILSRLLPLSLVALSTASATLIDFTSNAWSGANGVNSHVVNVAGVGNVTLQATGAALSLSTAHLTFNAPSCGNASVGLACQGDGIGINSRSIVPIVGTDAFIDEVDEVDLTEVLTITFATPTNIGGVDVLDLFAGETIQFSVNGGAFGSAFGGSATTGGFHATGFSANGVSTLALRAGGAANLLSSFSLARINAVPEPATLFTVGCALLGLGALRRRQA